MPPEEYSPLQELLLDPELHVVRALADVCHLDRVPLANSLLRIFRYSYSQLSLTFYDSIENITYNHLYFRHERKEADLLRSLNQAEVGIKKRQKKRK